jgi:hypothetical protein
MFSVVAERGTDYLHNYGIIMMMTMMIMTVMLPSSATYLVDREWVVW